MKRLHSYKGPLWTLGLWAVVTCSQPVGPVYDETLGECRECNTPALLAQCSDELDNDEDLLTDCDDPDCGVLPRCSAPVGVPENNADVCGDQVDNDRNGYTDCSDFGCISTAACQTEFKTDEDTNAACYDGLDNDHDGQIDCRDSDCANSGVTVCENSDATCSDGIDNDENGFTDCGDFSCSKPSGVVITVCR